MFKWVRRVAVGWVALLFFWQIWRSGWCNDESAHIPAGLYHLETSRMDAYRVNPPLPRLIGAIPLLFDCPQLEWYAFDDLRQRNEYHLANDWISKNTSAVPRQLRLARFFMVGFFVLGAWASFHWAHDLYGASAGYLALALWSLSPDVLTFAATVAPDLPAAATGLFAGYQFWCWLNRDEPKVPWHVGCAVALAILSKFSWLFLLVLLPILTFCRELFANGSTAPVPPIRGARKTKLALVRVSKLCFSFLLTWLVINSFYGFEGTGTLLGDYRFLSRSLAGNAVDEGVTGNRFADDWRGSLPVLLPKEMLQGIDYLRWEFERGYPCYLRGEWKDRGWWYFYVYAMGVKIPLGYWLLVMIAVITWLWDLRKRGLRNGEWLPLLMAILFVVQISSQTGFTHHVRYVLPAYGFLFVFASRVMRVLPKRFAICLAVLSLSGVIMFHALHPGLAHTFFNPLAGGPNQGWRHLGLSNVDWGQSSFRMAQWVKDHPQQRPMTVLFASIPGDPSRLLEGMDQVTFTVESTNNRPRDGWYLLSSQAITNTGNEYFQRANPYAQPYPDMLLFHVTTDR
jgi:hypothetical protein